MFDNSKVTIGVAAAGDDDVVADDEDGGEAGIMSSAMAKIEVHDPSS